MELFYVSGRELFSLIIQEVTFRAQKKKKKKKTEPTLKEHLIFQRMELSSSKLKKLLISIQEELTGSENEKILIFFSNTRFLILFLIKKQNFLNYNSNKAFFLTLQIFFLYSASFYIQRFL